MKYILPISALLIMLLGCIGLVLLSMDNRQLADEIQRLENELGRMTITDVNRVHLAEIKTPEVPSEVALHVKRVWQFRCYLPPGYDFVKFGGSGWVSADGLYHDGGYSSSSGTPKAEAIHRLMTISLQERDNRLIAFHCFEGSSGTTSWNDLQSDDLSELKVKQLVTSESGPVSFDQETILPVLKLYNPKTMKETDVSGQRIATYIGGLFVICPKSREAQYGQLRSGVKPPDFNSNWVANGVDDE